MKVACSNCGKKLERSNRQIARSNTGHFFCGTKCQNSSGARTSGYKTGPKPGIRMNHAIGCQCPWCSGKGARAHKDGCQCPWHRLGPPMHVKPLAQLLIHDRGLGPNRALKARILKEGLLKEVCLKCGLGPEWQGERLVLQLDHINGNQRDWRLENLQILCPNCHTQTKTYSNKKRV